MRWFKLLVLVGSVGCSASPGRPVANPGSTEPPKSELGTFSAAGPQSFTPETKPSRRETVVTKLWSASIGKTDARTTMAFVDGAVYVGTKAGKAGEAGIHVIDGRNGARRALLPAAQGDVVGIAIEGDVVYSTSSTGQLAATTKTGKVLFRAEVGAPITTPPTLLVPEANAPVDVAVGDAKGRVTLLDGRTGKIRWAREVGGGSAIGGGLAAADLDGDGGEEVVAGTENGVLAALRGKGGTVAWLTSKKSALRAAPVLVDVDDDSRLEVIGAWSDGNVAIVDGKSGKELWTVKVEEDDGSPVGLAASPTPLPGGMLLVPIARSTKDDSAVLLRAHDRAFRTREGAVTAAAVIGGFESGASTLAGIVGTAKGDVFGLDAGGGVHFVFHVDGAIEASGLLGDIVGNGLKELVVATRDGSLVALGVHGTVPPWVARGRGNALRNNGVLPPTDLGWHLP